MFYIEAGTGDCATDGMCYIEAVGGRLCNRRQIALPPICFIWKLGGCLCKHGMFYIEVGLQIVQPTVNCLTDGMFEPIGDRLRID